MVVAILYVFLLAPLVIVIVVSFTSSNYLDFPPPELSLRWYRELVSDSRFLTSALLSLRIGLVAMTLSVVLGVLISLALARTHLRFRWGFRLLALGPLIVPYVILGLGLFYVFLRLGLRGSALSVMLAHTVVTTPFVVVLVSSSLHDIPRNLREAAASLGGGPFVVFRRVTLPLIAPALAGSALIAFIISWDEFILAFLLSTPQSQTLPVLIFSLLRDRMEPTIAPISTLLIGVTVVFVWGFETLRRKAQKMRSGMKTELSSDEEAALPARRESVAEAV
ncbi:MAG: ABC transporter permease [Acidimicrobiia bacterium]|nr:MAG: ABC transporter permease [Acidimicrobiia bacterium]